MGELESIEAGLSSYYTTGGRLLKINFVPTTSLVGRTSFTDTDPYLQQNPSIL